MGIKIKIAVVKNSKIMIVLAKDVYIEEYRSFFLKKSGVLYCPREHSLKVSFTALQKE
jgi:hypothetical protein